MSVPDDAVVLMTDAPPASGLDTAAAPSRDGRGHRRTPELDVAVVICAYTQDRWDQTVAAISSVLSQRPGPAQVLLIVDHNPALAERARRELTGVSVVESDGQTGLSGARNTGLRASSWGITAFLDDDAAARPGWLASLVAPYADPDVIATAGSIHPRWLGDRPRWLPAEFYWVIGCSYRGLPVTSGPVRNPIGANMSLRTASAISAGGFFSAVGRAGGRLRNCEETELAIRLSAKQPGSAIIYNPAAAVDHNVGPERVIFRYFVRRCWHEGLSKATVVMVTGARVGLLAERRQVTSVLPVAMLREVKQSLTGDPCAVGRACAIVTGLAAATGGFVFGWAKLLVTRELLVR
jgi:glucosyl-dolichyl phosphate glucuronosyltransferase